MEKDEKIICNCLYLRRASQAITKIYDKFLEPSGLKISQYSMLKYINQMEPVNVSELAVRMKLDRTTLVRNLKPLEDMGLISDIAVRSSRNRQLILTDDGRKALSIAFPLWQDAQKHVEKHIGRNDLDTLLTLLSKIENL